MADEADINHLRSIPLGHGHGWEGVPLEICPQAKRKGEHSRLLRAAMRSAVGNGPRSLPPNVRRTFYPDEHQQWPLPERGTISQPVSYPDETSDQLVIGDRVVNHREYTSHAWNQSDDLPGNSH
jgi:hypothetical protein